MTTMYGFRINDRSMPTFVVTNRRMSKKLAREICKEMKYADADWMALDMMCCMDEATLKRETTPRSEKHCIIVSENYGVETVEEEKINIIHI